VRVTSWEADEDNKAVDAFAAALKRKLAKKRKDGRHGWKTCAPDDLAVMLVEHVEKGDAIDIGNFAMMLWHVQGRHARARRIEKAPLQTALRIVAAAITEGAS